MRNNLLIRMGSRAWFRLLVALCLVFNVTAGWLLMPASAAEPTVTFHGLEAGFAFAPGSAYTATDLFGAFENMMPGDSRTESIIFRNEARDCDYVNLYLHAVPHDPEGNPLSPALKQAGETEATANAFLAQLILQVRLGGSVLYSGPANAGLEAPVKLTNSDALIQTGQLRWPVYVLGGLGLLLLVLGCSMLLRKKRHG